MSDRSFGDHAFRNVVKNPLLSTSVTGLSIEDLTHNAVLLPAVPSQEMSTRRDERSGSQTRTLRHSEHDIANLPSGDANFNIYPPSTHTNVDLNTSNTQSVRSNELSTSNVSKTSAKSDDDFDVNEYFARLQGTRYVSAPLNSTLKEDQNANLQASEENLEEINLNEPEKGASPDVQQSITADIAQNFSQLPTVLPQMASVVFNSFSNILSMKSREQTPDESKSYYQETSVRPAEQSVPMMGVPDIVKDIAPPPLKEPPPVGTANYRITTRKKVYAQIPGLTSGETVHSMPTYNQPPVSQAAPTYFVPDANPVTLNTGEIDKGERKEIDNTPSFNTTDFNNAGDETSIVEVKSSTYDIFTPNVVADVVREVNVFNPPPIEAYTTSEQMNPLQSQLVNQTVQPPHSLPEAFAPPVNTQGPGTVIPPPPVSFNPLRTDNQTSVGKSVLPPSVARRISANQPILRSQPTSMPQCSNIFVPQGIPEGTQDFERPPETINTSLSTASICQTESVLPTASLPVVKTIITTGIPPSSSTPNMSTVTEPRMNVKPAVPQTVFAQTVPPSFPPSVLTSVPSGTAVSQEQNNSPAKCPPPIKPPAPQNLPQPSESVTGIIKLPEEKPNIVPNVAQTLFSPSSPNLPQEAVISATFSTDKNISTPPMFFNPVTSAQSYSGQTLDSNTNPLSCNTNQQNVLPQFFNPNDMPPAPITSIPEPPKLQGNTNYRMTKKKPQYYSGPIEGVGSISNNIKPVLNPVQSSSFQGSLFTPQESTPALSQSEPSYPGVDTSVGQIPFDNFTMPPIPNHNLSSSVTNVPQQQIHGHYDTPFDFSRTTTDRYEPPKQESTGFGLIGSLKSKLSSIDIGKIQNTVTTFFDPAYNEVRTEQPNQQNYSNEYNNPNNSSTSRQSQEQAVGLEMFVVPSAKPTHQFHNNYQQSYIPHRSHYGFIDQSRSDSTFQPTNFDLQTTPNQHGYESNRSDPITQQTTVIGYQQQSPSQYGGNEQFSSGAISQPSNQNNKYQKTSQYSVGGQIISEATQHSFQSSDFQATTQGYFDSNEPHRSDLTTKQIQAATLYDISGRIRPEPTAPQIIHDSNLQATTQSQHSIKEKEQLESTLKPSCHNLDTQAPTQGYGFNEQILIDSTSQKNSHDLKHTETSEAAQNVIEQMQSELTYQQSGHNLNQQVTTQSAFNENFSQVNFTKAFLQTDINNEDKERITKCLADFDVEKFKSLDFNETRAAIEALANALDPDYVDKDTKTKQAEPQFIGPGIILSMPGLTNDTMDQSITYPRILTDKPLTEEQHRKAYEELMNRSADIFDGDVSHVIEPSSRSPTPEIQQTISASANTTNMQMKQNQNLPGPSVVDHGYNSDFVSQYLSDNRATPSRDYVLKYDSSSDNTGSDSLRYFIPYKATPQTLEIIAKMGDITLNADDNTHKELDNFPNVIKRATEEKEINNVTKQLIENITAPIQLSNPVEVPLTESDVVIDDNPEFSSNQFAEISHITEETIETIQVQSATELLQDSNVDDTVLKNYIWRSKDAGTTSMALGDHTYTINPDTHHAGFSQNTSLFFDNVLTNASDELKAECKHSLDEHIVLPRQMSIPSAPPADDSKSDEGVLDVQSIEQDAKQDFMFIHEMAIEPETDDGKIKELERTSDDHAKEVESFTHRVEKYKQLEETTGEHDQAVDKPSKKPYPSYFDTGNFAADNHYKNSVPQQDFQSYESAPMRIPPGFEQEYYRKYNLINQSYLQSGAQDDIAEVSGLSTRSDNENVPQIPDTTTQTSVTQSVTVTSANLHDMEKIETSNDKIDALVEQFLLQKNEIKPRPMKFKRPNVVPLAHSLGMSPERMRELIGHQISNSPPLPSTMTSEDIIRDLILPHLHHSPIRNDQYEGEEFHEDDNAPAPATSNELSNNHNIPHVFSSDDREQESNEGINTPAEVLNLSNNRLGSTERIHSQELLTHESASGSQVNMGQSSTDYNEKDSSELQQQSITSATDSPFQGKQQTSTENRAALQDPMNFFTTHPTTFSTADHRVDDKIIPQQQEAGAVKTCSLPDPASFFTTQATTSAATSSNPDDEEELSSFSRLSSYFSAPPSKKEDHSKSFFELSQSQNHYRQNQPIQPITRVIEQNVSRFFDSSSNNVILQSSNANQTSMPNTQNIPQHLANMNLVRELASTKHFTPQNVVTTANYFTIHYDHDVSNFSKGEPDHINKAENHAKTNSNKNETISKESIKLGELGETEGIDGTAIINSCKNCCDMTSGRIIRFDIESVDLNDKIKHVMDSNTDTDKNKGGDNTMAGTTEIKKKVPHTVNFDPSSLQEDSDETETMMSENRSSSEYSPVKFHWFYLVDVEGKSVWRGFSMTDSRALERMFHSPDLNENTLVPTDGGRFDVNIMSRLRIAVYWSDKPTDVRRCSWFYKGTTDARYVPYEESVAEKLEEEYRHGITTGEWHRRLMLPNNEMVVMHGPAVMVHFLQTNNDSFNSSPQSMMRPRVVRRGYVQSEIEDCEPSNIDHLLLLCHGVGSACDMRFRAVEEVVDDFRTTSLQLLQSHYRNSYDNGLIGRIEVLPVSWHASLHSRETGIDRRLAAVTLASIPRLRAFTNDTVLDVLLYTSPRYCQHIINTVCRELNRIYSLFKKRNPDFKGGVSLGGHSLGSLILYDLLCHQVPLQESKILAGTPESPQKEMVKGDAGTGQPSVLYPPLEFVPDALYALGSPIAIFECIRGVETLGQDFCLPTCKNFFNIFHPYDPIAYRIEPMINPDLRDIKPYLIPHHKGRKRMHLELKDTMARVGADIKQKIIESIRSTWSSMWKTQPPPDTHLEKVVEEEMEKEECGEEIKEESNENAMTSPDMLGKLNAGRRIDYVLQEAPFEMINEYLFAMRSHVCYWESEDTMLLILREIYDSLGVQPDCSVPQQTMTIQRTKVINGETVTGAPESPSTSRGSS